MIKQTGGRDALNDFALKFAELNDDVLFGEVWAREEKLSLKIRSIVTITSLISKGILDSSLTYHLTAARKNGVTKTEMAEILTHIAFYAGPMHGRRLAWQRKFMRMTVGKGNMGVSLVRVSQIQLIPNISQETAT